MLSFMLSWNDVALCTYVTQLLAGGELPPERWRCSQDEGHRGRGAGGGVQSWRGFGNITQLEQNSKENHAKL